MTQLPIIPAPTPTISEPFFIDPKNFVLSLIAEGARLGILTQDEFDAVHTGILNILAENILCISKGRSTSVKEETAKTLFDNILFHIEAALKSSGTPQAAMNRLKTENIHQIYEDGRGMANKALDEACELWSKLNKTLRSDMDIYYKRLIVESLSAYLGNYDHKFEPKTELEIFLPSCGIDCRLCGIHEVLAAMREIASRQSFA
ncbi:MAG: hypothetical protein E7616_02175 [Ruminococcaceae bacterium]|nr:hypothetical protein [Oscillospiraceae bacterium]